jgi:glycosyltransferase involved in cell wall biosynthesis
VATGWLAAHQISSSTEDVIDYHVYARVPKWWRKLEQLVRMDLYLALKAQRLARNYDIVWADSEKVAIPLSFLKLEKPLLAVLHFPESPLKARLIRVLGIAERWAGVGIVSKDAVAYLQTRLGVDRKKIFQYYSARTDVFRPCEDGQRPPGPILSLGVTHRDYHTLIAALDRLPGYQTDLFVSSKYGDRYRGRRLPKIPPWVRLQSPISDSELVRQYQSCRYVVIPLLPTSHSGAGATTACEASASGKAVIATDTGGMKSYVVHGQTGILVPPKDVGALRDAIKLLWENPTLAAEMGRAGRRFVEKHYHYEVINAGVARFLSQLTTTARSA